MTRGDLGEERARPLQSPSPMSPILALVSGFGPFEAFASNPSGEVARALAQAPPGGLRILSLELPVSFERAPGLWDQMFATAPRPALFLGLGVARKAGFRLERWARPELELILRPDIDGRTASEFSRQGPRLGTDIDLVRVLAGLHQRGVDDVRISSSAGGYVCERLYHHLLVRSGQHHVPALFVHVPPLQATPLERQIQVVGWVLEELLLPRTEP